MMNRREPGVTPGPSPKPPTQSLPIASSGNPQAKAGRAFDLIVEHLQRRSPKPSSFLSDAEDQLAAYTDEFTRKLGVSAVDITNKRGGTAVDIPDVDAAYKSIMKSSDPRKQAWQLGIGGLAGGAGAGLTFTLYFATAPVPHEEIWWVAAITLTVVCAFFLYLSYPNRRNAV